MVHLLTDCINIWFESTDKVYNLLPTSGDDRNILKRFVAGREIVLD